MEKTKKSQNSALAVLAMLVAIIVVIFVIVPRVSAIRELSNQVTQKESELKAGQAKVEAVKQFALILKTAKNDIDKLGVSIPTEEKADEALLQAASAASSAGVSISSVAIAATSETVSGSTETAASAQQADTAQSPAKSGILSLTISTRGAYSAMLDYVKKLEENIRPVTIKGVAIAAVADSSDVDGNFTLDFPFVEESSQLTAETTNQEPEVTSAE